MEIIAKQDLSKVRQEEEDLKAKDAQLQSLGFSLAQEKAKRIQSEAMVNSLGQGIAQMKVEIMKLKGAASL